MGWSEVRLPDPLLAKEVGAPEGPASTQVKRVAGCSVTDRESPWATLLSDARGGHSPVSWLRRLNI